MKSEASDLEAKRLTVPELILRVLSDGREHFSAEFRDRLGLLEYRKPITRLRRRGFQIEAVNIWDAVKNCYRPGYRMTGAPEALHG